MTLDIRIDWSELDLFGHVNNMAFFKYQQAARVHYWEEIGLQDLYETDRIGPLLASATLDFKKPLHYPGTVRIETQVVAVRNTSFRLEHRMYDGQGALCAAGQDIIVLYDYQQGEKAAVPPGIRKRIEAQEGRPFPSPETA